jgi:23S rRNA (uracil1939-C5)-methyltransferase
MERANTNQTLDVEIERILPGGVGLAHANGLTIFVSLAAPGDFVRVAITRKRGKTAFAKVIEVLNPSPVRVEPPCPYFGRCGGCDFQQLSYQAQLDAKLDIVRDCLHRIARIDSLPQIPIHASPNEWQYRSRTNWQFDPQRQRLGYFEGGSHSVCDVEFCAVLVPELQKTLEHLREELRNGGLLTDSNETDAVTGLNGVSVAPRIDGFDTIEVVRRVAGETYRFNAASFFQINHEMLEPLTMAAIGAAANPEGVAVDLYSGVGLFTLPLARRFRFVTAVEANPAATTFARHNVNEAGLTNVEVVNSRVGDWLLEDAAGLTVDFLLLDPPRSGAEPSAIDGIIQIKPKQISYVSCDPATLARDLKILLAAGYSLDSVTAFDMFPQTHHVETVARLNRLPL